MWVPPLAVLEIILTQLLYITLLPHLSIYILFYYIPKYCTFYFTTYICQPKLQIILL